MHRLVFIIVCLVSFVLAAATSFAANQNNIQAKVHFQNKSQYIAFLASDLDIVSRGDDFIEIITNADELRGLQENGYLTEIIHERLAEFYRSRMLARPTDMGGYKTLGEIYAALDTIVADHSDIVSPRQSIGKTIQNRDMWAVKISDNHGLNEDEPEILFTAAIHAREVITPLVLLYFMDHLTDNYGSDPDVTYLVDNREIWFVLPVNPDGYYHNEVIEPGGGGMWRKNRRNNLDGTYGVDLNRNYGYEWGYDDQGSSPNTDAQTYRGTGPFSEPETQNMRDFIESHEFDITIYYHAHGELVLWPWGYDRIYAPDNAIFAAMGDSINAMNGYAPGPGWILYVTNGDSDDWGYGEQETKNKNFSMTFEVGGSEDGFWPELSRIPQLIQENLGPNLYLTSVAGSLQSLLPPAVPSVILPASVDSAGYDVIWTIYDTINPAVAFELTEMQGFNTITDPATELGRWKNHEFILSGDRSNSGPTSFYSGEDNNLSRYIQTEESYPVEVGDTLRFWTWFETEVDWDYAYVEISTDGQSFSPIEGNITTNYNPNGNNRGEGMTGSSSGWTEGLFDLADYTGQNVWIRFSYSTDGYVTEEGFYVDDIYPVAGYSSSTVVSSSIVDTSYSFAEKPSGVYYYKVRAQDAEDQWSDFSVVAQTVVSGGGACVDSDGDGYGDPGNPGNTCPDDNCPGIFNPDQADSDSDGVGDLCDKCPGFDDSIDNDADGVPDSCDVCLALSNPDQVDSDDDGVGDPCDNCPNVANPDQADANADNVGDACCCVGTTGNVDCDPEDNTDLGDLTELIDYLFISFQPLCCPMEANVDGDPEGTVDLGDLTGLIDYLFISFTPLAQCQ